MLIAEGIYHSLMEIEICLVKAIKSVPSVCVSMLLSVSALTAKPLDVQTKLEPYRDTGNDCLGWGRVRQCSGVFISMVSTGPVQNGGYLLVPSMLMSSDLYREDSSDEFTKQKITFETVLI